VCTSADPRDRRLRPSIFVDAAPRARILVDAGPDLRQQALTFGVTNIDAILLTHAHADHILGLDEVRRFNVMRGGPIPCYADAPTWSTVRRTFHYIFDEQPRLGGGIPQLEACEVHGPLLVAGVFIVPVPVWHGTMPVLGFRFGGFAYLTDCNRIEESSIDLVSGVDTLVIDALRDRPHVTHFSVEEALGIIDRIKPRRAYMTHMTHDLPHAATNARLPAGVELAYDGLVIDVRVDVE
jgi:phosphoribosyl 1,2-cyclic phosphate phosphodiesterase